MKKVDATIELELTDCPLCGSAEYEIVEKTQDNFCGLPGEFTFTKCQHCTHVFLNPRPTPGTIANCYPKHYSPHVSAVESNTEKIDEKPWFARPPIRWIPGLKQFYHWLMKDYGHIVPKPEFPEMSALEIGTGRGAFLKKLDCNGWVVRGIEPSEQAAMQARWQGYDVEIGSLEDAEFGDQSLHAIFAWMVLEHLISPQLALSLIFKWLVPGGKFYFSVPNFGCLEPTLFGKHWIAWEAPRHLHQFRTRTLRKILAEAGFDDVKIIHQRNIRDFYGSAGAWLLSRNPNSKMGQVLMSWFADSPPFFVHVALAPAGILLAMLRQGGRISIIAQKPASSEGKE